MMRTMSAAPCAPMPAAGSPADLNAVRALLATAADSGQAATAPGIDAPPRALQPPSCKT